MIIRPTQRWGILAFRIWQLDLDTGGKGNLGNFEGSKGGKRWEHIGVNCAERAEEPGHLDNTWGELRYQDDYAAQSRVRA